MRLGTGRGWRPRRATAVAAVGVVATVLAAVPAGGARAATGDSTSTTRVPPATIVTVPANQTKILQVDPATTTTAAAPTTTPGPALTTPTTAQPAAVSLPSPAASAATVSADSPGLEALVATSAAGRRQLQDDADRADADLAGLRSAFDAAQHELSTREEAEQEARAQADKATADLDAAESRLADAASAADAAAVAGGATRTPVASPPSRGHTPRDAVAQAREAVVAATQARDAARAALIDRTHALDLASDATAAAGADLTARADDLQRGLDAADQAHQQLAGDGSATVAAAGGSVTLRPAPTAVARATIPADYLVLYGRAAATCKGLPWLVLAAIGSVESAHGQSDAPGVHQGTNVAGAMGPMQFLAGTWAAYGVDGDGDGTTDVYDPADAIFGAANYLCATGGGDLSTLRRALWDYNHADWYVEEVLQLAARY